MSPTFRRIALQRTARLFDLAAVSVTFFAAFAIAAGAFTWPSLTHIFAIRIAVFNVLFLVGYLALCSVTFSIFTFYRSHRLSHWSRRVREIVLAVTLITGILLLLRTPLVFSFATNTFLLIFWLLTTAVLLLSHIAAQQFLYYVRSRGRNLRSIVIVGEGPEAAALAERIESDPARGYRVVRIIDAKETRR